MQYAQLKHIPNVDMDDIYTGNGVSELIQLSMQALLDNGDDSYSSARSAVDRMRHARGRYTGSLYLRRAIRLVP